MKKHITISRSKLVLLFTFFITTSLLSGQDWPQFMGPDRDGTSPQKKLLRSWPAEGPEVLWTAEVGRGYGGPVVKDGRVYLLDRNDEVGDKLRCFDLKNGEEIWHFEYDAPGSVSFPGSRSVPAVDGEYLYSCGHNGDLYCLDIHTQAPVWNANIWTDFGGQPGEGSGRVPFGPRPGGRFPIWAISQCPLVYQDMLILASQAPEAGVVAYDKRTGALKWKTDSLGYVGYVSPSIVKVDEQDQVVMVTPSTNPHRKSSPNENIMGKIVGINPSNGDILWEYDDWYCHIPVASAVDAGHNKLLVVGGYELGAVMLEVARQADGSYRATEVFKTEEFGDQTKPPLLIDGYFYAQYGTNNRRDGLVCMDMDGQIMWKTKRDPGFNKGSMILADGLILATDGTSTLYLIEPDPGGFKALCSAELMGSSSGGGDGMSRMFGTQNWAPISLADGKLIIRDQSRLICLKVAE